MDITPDGHGDCIRNVIFEEEEEAANNNNQHDDAKAKHQRKMFVKPHEETMEIGKFCDMLRRGERSNRSRHDDADGMKMKLCHENLNGNVSSSSLDGILPKKIIDHNGLEVFPLHNRSKTCTTDAIIELEHSDTECFLNEDRRTGHHINNNMIPPVVYYSRQVRIRYSFYQKKESVMLQMYTHLHSYYNIYCEY